MPRPASAHSRRMSHLAVAFDKPSPIAATVPEGGPLEPWTECFNPCARRLRPQGRCWHDQEVSPAYLQLKPGLQRIFSRLREGDLLSWRSPWMLHLPNICGNELEILRSLFPAPP